MRPLWLKIFHQGKLLDTKLFTNQQISLGSGQGLTVQLQGLSPWHALIERKLDAYYVFDLGSEQGTFVNGKRIAEETLLVSGSALRLGSYDIQFFTAPPPAAGQAASQSPPAPAPSPQPPVRAFGRRASDFPPAGGSIDRRGQIDRRLQGGPPPAQPPASSGTSDQPLGPPAAVFPAPPSAPASAPPSRVAPFPRQASAGAQAQGPAAAPQPPDQPLGPPAAPQPAAPPLGPPATSPAPPSGAASAPPSPSRVAPFPRQPSAGAQAPAAAPRPPDQPLGPPAGPQPAAPPLGPSAAPQPAAPPSAPALAPPSRVAPFPRQPSAGAQAPAAAPPPPDQPLGPPAGPQPAAPPLGPPAAASPAPPSAPASVPPSRVAPFPRQPSAGAQAPAAAPPPPDQPLGPPAAVSPAPPSGTASAPPSHAVPFPRQPSAGAQGPAAAPRPPDQPLGPPAGPQPAAQPLIQDPSAALPEEASGRLSGKLFGKISEKIPGKFPGKIPGGSFFRKAAGAAAAAPETPPLPGPAQAPGAAAAAQAAAPAAFGGLPLAKAALPIGSYQKPDKKGFWRTFAPPGKIESLDSYLQPSVGNLIEALVAWKERVLSVFYFFQEGEVYMGSGKDCQIPLPNMQGAPRYKLLEIASGARVFLEGGVKGCLFQGKEQSTRTAHPLPGNQTIGIKPFEMVRLDFNESLKVYVRILQKQAPPPMAGLFNLRFSEAVALFLSVLLSLLLVFYVGIYAPAFLMEDTKFQERELRAAVVKFEKKPQKKVYKMGKKDVKKRVKARPVPVKKTPKKRAKKKASLPSPKKRKKVTRKKIGLTRAPPKKAKLAAQAPGKNPKKKKASIGSVRPGGSLKTGKAGSSAKTKSPDPSKVGLLGIFGGGGKLKSLDRGSSGAGGLVGLAQEATGRAGTKEAYGGAGIGSKTKELGSGGRGTSLVGIGGIKTKGRGSLSRGAGPLGSRGQISIEFGEDDMDVEGEIDRAAILRVIRRNEAKFNNCYHVSLQREASLQGALKLQWDIRAGGRARAVKAIQDQVGSRSLISCMSRTLQQLNFPSPPSGQTPVVSFKFVFSK